MKLFDAPIPIPPTEPMAYVGRITGWEATDGHYEAGSPGVRPDHKRLVRSELGKGTVSAGISVHNFVAKLEEALSFSHLQQASSDSKLTLAIEVALGHRFEASENAKFISLVTSLEALTPELAVSGHAASIIDAASKQLRSARDSTARESPEWEDLNRMLGRMNKLKTDSIGEGIRSLVADAISRDPSLGDPGHTSKHIRQAYETRSRLLHDGYVAPERLRDSLEFVRTFVPSLLRSLFVQRANGSWNAL